MASSLAATQYLSVDLMMEACTFLSGLNHDIVDIIIEINKDVGNNKELGHLVSSLVDLYLKSTMATLNLFNTVENLVERAKNSQHIIQNAVKQFEAESEDTDVGGSKKKMYAKTLEELNKFEATGDPLGEEFLADYKSVVDQQIKLLEDLCEQKLNLDKKLKNPKRLKKISYLALGAVATVLAAIAMITPVGPHLNQMAKAYFARVTQPMAARRVSREMLKKYENAVKTYKGLHTSAEKSTKVNKEATETINSQVKNLTGKISSILEQVDFAVEREEEEEEATRLAMQEIMTNVEGFTKKFEEVGKHAATLSKSIFSGRVRLLVHINNSKGE